MFWFLKICVIIYLMLFLCLVGICFITLLFIDFIQTSTFLLLAILNNVKFVLLFLVNQLVCLCVFLFFWMHKFVLYFNCLTFTISTWIIYKFTENLCDLWFCLLRENPTKWIMPLPSFTLYSNSMEPKTTIFLEIRKMYSIV